MYGLKPVPFKDGTLLLLELGSTEFVSSQLFLFTSKGWRLRSMGLRIEEARADQAVPYSRLEDRPFNVQS
jgi:hypothetical protein